MDIATFLLIFVSIVALLGLHEFGHFITAKKFGIKVKEFGFGYPPRLFGKKFGDTLYSLNLLPFGAFVSIPSMEGGEEDDPNSFSQKPIWQRALVLFAGVAMFWIIAWILFSVIIVSTGLPTAISDDAQGDFNDPVIKIIGVVKESPAAKAGIKLGDDIKKISFEEKEFSISKVVEVQELIGENKGKEITLTIQRGQEIINIALVPRINAPEEGAIGIEFSRVALVKSSWWEAPWKGAQATYRLTLAILEGFASAITKAIVGAPSGVQLMGIVGLFDLMGDVAKVGISYYLQFVAIISIHLAILNLLPVPALDGGRIFFLGIEKIKGSPINRKIEQSINNGFFILLIILMILITYKDIQALIFKYSN